MFRSFFFAWQFLRAYKHVYCSLLAQPNATNQCKLADHDTATILVLFNCKIYAENANKISVDIAPRWIATHRPNETHTHTFLPLSHHLQKETDDSRPLWIILSCIEVKESSLNSSLRSSIYFLLVAIKPHHVSTHCAMHVEDMRVCGNTNSLAN